MSRTSAKVVVDRIEGTLAVLVLYEDDRVKFNFPVSRLPGDLREGDHLIVSFEKSEESRAAEEKKAVDLLRELAGRNKSE
ncbi:MAG: DUF3006 domain-containing protein [Blastocatellia bacterium AA13]|nr:MAG: DUF3006 domain-containing protein [Blastocatellia bacterium AA13]